MADKKSTCKGHFMWGGIIAILLGIILWFAWLNLTQTIAIILVLVGLKHLIYKHHCC